MRRRLLVLAGGSKASPYSTLRKEGDLSRAWMVAYSGQRCNECDHESVYIVDERGEIVQDTDLLCDQHLQ